jgi:hypothetical protein
MPLNTLFDARNLSRLEALLLAHPVTQTCLQGRLYAGEGQCLTALTLTRDLDVPLRLDAVTLGRLCMVPDGALVTATRSTERAATPAGIGILAHHARGAGEARNKVVVYCAEEGTALWIDSWREPGAALAQSAPSCFMCVAFGFMAITAYRLGLTRIGVIGSGQGEFLGEDVGPSKDYAVWPKFGFDAAVSAAEIDRYPERALHRATSIQDVRRAVPGWWEAHGTGRAMSFDLAAGSRSWAILFNYLYSSLAQEPRVDASVPPPPDTAARSELASAQDREEGRTYCEPAPVAIMPVGGKLLATLAGKPVAPKTASAESDAPSIDDAACGHHAENLPKPKRGMLRQSTL